MTKVPDLQQQPKLPSEVVQAGLAGDLVLFVGAGISRLCGLPSWDGLAINALRFLREKGCFNYSVLDLLRRLDPKKQLSIAELIAEEDGIDLSFAGLLGANNGELKIYDYINAIGCTCVTTNYDELLSPKFLEVTGAGENPVTPASVNRINEKEKFLPKYLDDPGVVIHLHGSVSKPETMIVTTKDYLAHYDDPIVQQFLTELFAKKTVLFLGYGLEEVEILEYIFRRGHAGSTHDRRRFALQGYFQSERELYEKLDDYYNRSFGVRLIGFLRDHEDYHQQERILRDWSEEIQIKKPPLMTGLVAISAALKDG